MHHRDTHRTVLVTVARALTRSIRNESIAAKLSIPIRVFALIIGACLTLTAAEPEFPDDWYFDPEGGVRTTLEGKPAIAWSAETWIGDSWELDACRGKVVVLDFWATWCGPCVASIPKNIELVKDHPDDLVFVGMHSATSGWDKAPQMVEDREINYPVALDTGDTLQAYGVTAFPTYVIIDRDGMIRAAGVTPNHIREIVETLLEESGPSRPMLEIATFQRDWFYQGAMTMRAWQEQHGQASSPIQAVAWWDPTDPSDESSTADDEQSEPDEPTVALNDETATDAIANVPVGLRESDLQGVVRVLHFTRPGLTITQTQLKKLNETASKYSPQGVSFAVVCDHQSNWQETQTWAKEAQLQIPMALDASIQDEADGATAEPADAPTPREAGITAQRYHIRIAPVTVLVDRQGRIRATGLKLENLDSALDVLLSEPAG